MIEEVFFRSVAILFCLSMVIAILHRSGLRNAVMLARFEGRFPSVAAFLQLASPATTRSQSGRWKRLTFKRLVALSLVESLSGGGHRLFVLFAAAIFYDTIRMIAT